MIALPPSLVGAVNAMDAEPLAPVAAPITGAPGTPIGFAATSADAALVPALFVAFTLHAYVAPLVRPVTLIGLVPLLAVCVGSPVALHVAV